MESRVSGGTTPARMVALAAPLSTLHGDACCALLPASCSSEYLSVHPPICPSAYLSIRLSVYPPICPSVCPSVLSVRLSCLSVCLQGDVVPIANPVSPPITPSTLPPFNANDGSYYGQLQLSSYTAMSAAYTYYSAGLTEWLVPSTSIPMGLNTTAAYILIAPNLPLDYPKGAFSTGPRVNSLDG